MKTSSEILNGLSRSKLHNLQLKLQAQEQKAQRKAEGLARASKHNHDLTIAKHKKLYGGYQIPMFE